MGKIRIGISGWSYDEWRGSFYPADLERGGELAYASRRLDTIEINGSFYALQRPETYRDWYESVPAHFTLAVKGSRFITHDKKLSEPEKPLANFLASGVLRLGEKLGPILWQLPAHLGFDPDRLGRFLELLPHTTEEAADLARRHDRRVEGRAWTEVEANHRLRHALEVRDEGSLVPELAAIARETGTALVVSHSGSWPCIEEITAGFVYVRLHGAPDTYGSRYDDEALDRWARRIRAWRAGGEPADAARITGHAPPPREERDVYVYFDNDRGCNAPSDALRLRERLGGTS